MRRLTGDTRRNMGRLLDARHRFFLGFPVTSSTVCGATMNPRHASGGRLPLPDPLLTVDHLASAYDAVHRLRRNSRPIEADFAVAVLGHGSPACPSLLPA